MEWLRFLVYPAVGAFLGFITNFIAIKLLFHPRKRILGIQGLLPKRKAEIAERAGEIVNQHLINSSELRRQVDREKLEKAVEKLLDTQRARLLDIPLVRVPLVKVISVLLIDKDGYFNRRIIESVMHEEMVSDIVRQKINEFDVNQLESLVKSASGPEFRFIMLSGAGLGLFIGLTQAFIGL
jgi:uncharacterized membrane protein YheB (UPF0754 family)